jgi:hypothetical protein
MVMSVCGPQGRSGRYENYSNYQDTNSETSVVQPVVSCYTDSDSFATQLLKLAHA